MPVQTQKYASDIIKMIFFQFCIFNDQFSLIARDIWRMVEIFHGRVMNHFLFSVNPEFFHTHFAIILKSLRKRKERIKLRKNVIIISVTGVQQNGRRAPDDYMLMQRIV